MKIITLTLNPAIDVHCLGDVFIPFSENLFKIESKDAGGKGINISRALNSHNVENLAVILVGDENGKEFLKELDDEKIAHKEVFVTGRIRENITLHNDNRETRISFEGFRADGDELSEIKKILFSEKLENSVLVLAGRLPLGISAQDIKGLLKELKSKGAKIIIDSKSFTIEDLLEIKPFLIKPNEEEIFMYTDIFDLSLDSLRGAAKELKSSGIENVLISLGEKGALLCTDEGTFFGNAPKIKMLSTIGAGDSMIAGFISAVTKGLCPEEALKTAIASGSAACLKEGTAAPDIEDIERLLNEITIIKG